MISEGQPYGFESHVYHEPYEPEREDSPGIEAYLRDPREYFSESPRSEKEKYALHRENRRLLVKKEHFLGSGNDGFVASVDKSFDSYICVKYVWDKLEVIPGSEMDLESLDDEISKLYEISVYFERIRAANQRVSAETNRASIPPNKPLVEAMLQDMARKILEENNVGCNVPRIIEVDSFEEIEEDHSPHSYSLHESYSTIMMEKVRGLSVQDLITGYPETSEYLETLDVDAFEKGLVEGLQALHKNGIKHQDITIRNVMVELSTGNPVIIDFGKATYGGGIEQADDEIRNNAAEVVSHLRAFVRNPDMKKSELLVQFNNQSKRLGI